MEEVHTISTDVNVLKDFSPEIPVIWNDPDVLFCANTHPRTQVSVLDQCPGAAVTALDSFMLWIETEFETLSEALRKVDVAILNEEEVCSIAGDGILSRAVDMVHPTPAPEDHRRGSMAVRRGSRRVGSKGGSWSRGCRLRRTGDI